jgi:dihydroflavonol-4-reductase
MDGVGKLAGVVLCPGMVLGPRDVKPTSTRVPLVMAATRIAVLPGGGIPVVDSGVVAHAHREALVCGEPGTRYAIVGPYLSYRAMARLVARIAGRPWMILPIPDLFERPLVAVARSIDRRKGGGSDVSAAAVAGGFLRLHVCGDRANLAFGLVHPPPISSLYRTLDDSLRSGRTPWLRLRDFRIAASITS